LALAAPASAHTAASGGTWQPAQVVAGALNVGGRAQVNDLSCGSAGNCSAGGFSTASNAQAVVVNEVNGAWSKAQLVPGLSKLYGSQIFTVSCAAASRCSAGGVTGAKGSDLEAIVANET
jgi:hypothetical protein